MEPLTVTGTLDSLNTIGEYVMKAAAVAEIPRRAAYRLRLAVDEIATNAILHGYERAGREGDVRVEADIDADTLTIVLEDTGRPFNPLQHDTPDEDELGQSLEEREIGGLGVFLALRGVDEFRHEHTGQRNRNIFVVKRPGAAEKPATSKEESS